MFPGSLCKSRRRPSYWIGIEVNVLKKTRLIYNLLTVICWADNDLVVSDLLRDQQAVEKYLVEDLNVLSREVARALLNSTIKATKVTNLTLKTLIHNIACSEK